MLGNIFKTVGKVILHILILVLIPLDLMMININETLALVLTIGWIVLVNLVGIILRKKQEKKSGKTGIILFGCLDVIIILFMFVASFCNFYWNSECYRKTNWNDDSGNSTLTREQAIKDYEFALHYLNKVHPVTHSGLPADMQAQADKVRADLESAESITGCELSRELESIFSMLGDGHSEVEEWYETPHYMKHIYEHKKAGDTAIGINGIMYPDMLKQYSDRVSCDTTDYGIRMLKNRTGTIEGLRYLGIDTTGEIIYNYQTENGEYVDEVVTAEDFIIYDEYIAYEESVTGDDLDGSDSNEESEKDFVSYEIDEELSLAIFTLDDCTYNQHFRDVVAEMFEEVHSKNIQNIAVDLRNNPGGSSRVGDEFINYLDVDTVKNWASELRCGPFYFNIDSKVKQNQKKGYSFDGNVYIITSVFTYSSAMDFAMMIQDNGLGKIVGEPSGNLPASYGEVASFKLPESGLYMQLSSCKWHRVDETKEGLQIIPDIPCDPDDAIDVIKNEIGK